MDLFSSQPQILDINGCKITLYGEFLSEAEASAVFEVKGWNKI
jgi:hypothetical protein